MGGCPPSCTATEESIEPLGDEMSETTWFNCLSASAVAARESGGGLPARGLVVPLLLRPRDAMIPSS